jgi:tRNA(Ile)-lysidine synthase
LPSSKTDIPQFICHIHDFIAHHDLLPKESTIVVGFSGGPDSLFLLHLLHEYYDQKGRIKLIAAHLNHQWRPGAEDDVIFCKTVTEKIGIPFVHAKADDLPERLKKHGSQEEIGRRMRRYFLQSVLEQYDADFIALGHHAQDQQETFFIRLIRGTTLSGLTCMKPKDGVYIRPLLETNKSDILNYLDTKNISYLIDPSNVSESFLRNRIRLHVLPAIERCDDRFNQNFIQTLHALQSAEQFLEHKTNSLFYAIAEYKDGSWQIDIKKLQKCHPFMQNRLIMQWLIQEGVPFTPSQGFIEEIKRFLYQSEGKTHSIHQQWIINKKQAIAWIKRV